MEFKTLIYEKGADGIATITFNRPKEMNSSNQLSVGELAQAVADANNDDAVTAVIVTGGPNVFAAGGDIKYMSGVGPLEAEAFITKANVAMDSIANSSKPYIAAIGGLALGGGCEMALACDIRLAADNAVFGQPEINLAIIPGGGGTQRLGRVVGAGWARHLILTGEMIDAQTAFNIGLVTKVVAPDELLATANKYAKSLGRKSKGAMAAAKKCLLLSETTDLATGLSYEQKAWSFLFGGEDQKEGMKAFLEKRRPEYTGK
ncbi:MAG: enoyl-CoA hydratase/isomerase family protein [Syntrophomonadaceae bacterium]|mgnify:FL=1|jgi:enoyl-CoA hydratase/carnithine racemase|nr:enoyl-CoA hydratase/isomerase family protein [Syntrophomonadaceae bacterium]